MIAVATGPLAVVILACHDAFIRMAFEKGVSSEILPSGATSAFPMTAAGNPYVRTGAPSGGLAKVTATAEICCPGGV